MAGRRPYSPFEKILMRAEDNRTLWLNEQEVQILAQTQAIRNLAFVECEKRTKASKRADNPHDAMDWARLKVPPA